MVLLLSQSLFAQFDCGGRYQTAIFTTASQQLVNYDTAAGWDNSPVILQMLLFTPDGDTLSNRPAVLVMHGGSFTSGTIYSSEVVNLCRHLTLRGYVTVSVGYRLGIAPWTNSLEYVINYYHALYRASQDAKSAIRFLKANAGTYGVDTSLIFIGGYSAGAANALSSAFWQQHEVIPIIDTSVWGTFRESATHSNRVTGVFGIGGAMQDTVLIESDILPSAFVHGVTDQIVPFTSGADNSGVTIYGSNAIHTYLQNHGGLSFLKAITQPGFHTPAAGSALEDTVNEFLTNSLFSFMEHLSKPSMSFSHDTLTSSKGDEYNWFLNGSLIANQSLQHLIIPQSGYYQVEVNHPFGCSHRSDSAFFSKQTEIRDTNVFVSTVIIADTSGFRDTVEIYRSNITDTVLTTTVAIACDSFMTLGPTTSMTDSTYASDTLFITETSMRYDTLHITCSEVTIDSIFIPAISNASIYPDKVFTSVYPNPSNGSFIISLRSRDLQKTEVKLVDLTGKEVYNFSSGLQHFSITLPLTVQPGIYFLHLTNATESAAQKLLILRN